jgi:acetyl-CoA C-acetyltransferase
MPIDPNTPVLLGAGQFTEHLDDNFKALMPEDLAARACEAALADTGAAESLHPLIDRLACVRLFAHSVPDPIVPVIAPFGRSSSPPLSILSRLALPNASALYSRACGDEPQRLVYELGNALARGEINGAIICGAEALATSRQLQRQGLSADWSDDPEGETDDRGACIDVLFDAELNRHGAWNPIDIYPLQEQVRRSELGLSKSAYRTQLAELMARFASVASANPYAMFGNAMTAGEIGEESSKNRLMGDPHLKSMVAKDGVNQASALVLTRWETAQSLGVADRAIFLHGHGTGSEPQVLNRSSMGQSESMAAAYRDALAGAGIEAEQLGAADLYSCFPIAVWVAMDALGMQLDDPRPLTLTGGLPFFGGPGNNYSTHGIAEMVHWLRAQPVPSYGAVGANGGYLSKHAVGVYANIPAEFPKAAPEFKAPESVEVVSDPEPNGVIESYTFQWQKDAPRAVIVGRQVSDGRRWVGVADPEDAELLAWFEKADPLGERVEVSAGERNIVRRRGQ